jgi:hypothetical protein
MSHAKQFFQIAATFHVCIFFVLGCAIAFREFTCGALDILSSRIIEVGGGQ